MYRRTRLAPILLLLPCLALGGCGEDETTPGESEVLPEPGRATPAGLLADLAARVGEGRGISDQTWSMQVAEVGMALWPGDESPTALAGRRDHTNLAHIAGDMARRLAQDPGLREESLASDPSSLGIHDAFVQASAAGEDAYRAWVEDGGRRLLEERVRAISGERPPR